MPDESESGASGDQSVFAKLDAANAALGHAADYGKEGNEAVSREQAKEVSERKLMAAARNIGKTGNMDLTLSMGKPRDPMWYWRNNNEMFDVTKEESLAKLRQFCRQIYLSHPLLPSVIDTFARFPVMGLELVCKDDELAKWYTDLFLDDLNYEEFLIEVLRQYWLVGEAFPWGSFNDLLGVWESDELLSPDDVRVINSPFLSEPRYLMRLPEQIRAILQNHAPMWEYQQLIEAYPELSSYRSENDWLPVSNVLIQHIKFSGNPFHPRGIPILMRAMRSLLQEEMLNSAQDAIASRLYTPLLIAKIGASAQDTGTNQPWVPTKQQLAEFEAAFDTALSADFRLLTTHWATELESVLGRETMPDFTQDFDRLTEQQLGVFGISKTLLTGADAGATYAADALNFDLLSSLLGRAQKLVARLMRQRMEVVAEAQEHYDYTLKGGKRVPIIEEVLEIDPESGEQQIIERPKLLVPEPRFLSMNMNEDEKVHQFLETLAASGAPISYKSRLTNIPVDFSEEAELKQAEDIELAVINQETRKKIYQALQTRGLPIPEDLLQDFGPHVMQQPGKAGDPAHELSPSDTVPPPLFGTKPLAPSDALAPTSEDYESGGKTDVEPTSEQSLQTERQTLPRNRLDEPFNPDKSARPPQSDEQRQDMPKRSASLHSVEASPEDQEDQADTPAWGSDTHDDEVADHSTDPNDDPSTWDAAGSSSPAIGEGALGRGPRHVGKRSLRVTAAYQRINPDPTQSPYDDDAPTLKEDQEALEHIASWTSDPFLGVPDDGS